MQDQTSAPALSGLDLEIYENVKDALENLITVRESNPDLQVSVKDGVVTISGTTFTETIRRQVLYAAAKTTNVSKVIDVLWDDTDIRVEAAKLIATDAELAGTLTPLRVNSYQGSVTLSGKISTEAQRQRAIEIAAAIAGVREVIDHLRLVEAN